MKENRGWIKIYTKITKWCWYDDINTRITFLHLLLTVNWEDKNWHGIVVKRGSRVFGRIELAKEVGISVQQLRTSLGKLSSTSTFDSLHTPGGKKSTSEITIKSYSKYSVVSINNYDDYQESTSISTNNQPATNQQLTTTEEYKNIRNKEYISPTPLKTYGKEEWTLEQVGKALVEAFNIHLNRKFKYSPSILKGLEAWLKVYEPVEIEDAISQVKFDKFWSDKMTPTILFRQKNPQGEPVDYIGGLLNKKETYDDSRRKS